MIKHNTKKHKQNMILYGMITVAKKHFEELNIYSIIGRT